MDTMNRAVMWLIAVSMWIMIVVVGVLNSRVAMLHNLSVTPQQLDSALVEAAYRLMSERDSVIRECVVRLGPLDPECRP